MCWLRPCEGWAEAYRYMVHGVSAAFGELSMWSVEVRCRICWLVRQSVVRAVRAAQQAVYG